MMFPLCHVAGVGVISNVLMGVTLVLRRAYEPLDAMTMIDRYGVTSTSFAPTMLSMLLQHPQDRRVLPGVAAHDRLRRLVDAGRDAAAGDGPLPGADFVQGFGMTELSGNVLYFDPASHRLAATSGPSCSPPPGARWRSAASGSSTTTMRDVPVGEVGEIVVQGDQVMLGYWRRPEATEEAFAGGWFHTGDIGRADEQGFTASSTARRT